MKTRSTYNQSSTKNSVRWGVASFVLLTIAGCADGTLSDSERLLQLSDHIVVDTFEVAIVRDETPGFSYPIMHHSVNFVGHLDVPGYIDQFFYKSEGVERGIIYDYGGRLAAGERVRYNISLWNSDLLEAGVSVPYQFSATSPFAKPFTADAAVDVVTRSDGIRPALNSRQLTGPENANGSPVFSRDGQTVYFKGWDRKNRLYSISRVPAAGGLPENILETEKNIGGFTLTSNDSLLAYIEWGDGTSKLIELALDSRSSKETPIQGNIWDAHLVAVPGTSYFVTLADPNKGPQDLVRINATLGTVEVLEPATDISSILHYDHRPGTTQISMILTTSASNKRLVLVDVESLAQTVNTQQFEGHELVWAPDGEAYAFVKNDAPPGQYEPNIYLFENGVERQLTTYPGDEEHLSFSSDGRHLVFSARRRGEQQVWRMEL